VTESRAASRTAIMVAAYRGRASAAPNAICEDPWALRLAGPEGEALSRQLELAFEQEVGVESRLGHMAGQLHAPPVDPQRLFRG